MEILYFITSMAPFLLLGFFLAGIMHVFVPPAMYRRHLGPPTFRSVLYATLIGIPIPLCSCGVIPTAMSLRKEGASKGSVISFLIATPQTGVDSILATYSMMGLPFAIVRPIAALVTALFGGAMSNLEERWERRKAVSCACDAAVGGAAGCGTAVGGAASCGTAVGGAEDDEKIMVGDSSRPKGLWAKIKAVFRYAYFEMMQDIGKWLVVGLIIAGLITLFVPDSFFEIFKGNTLLSILVVLVCAIPMYLCATGSIPIAIALMMKGLSPGAALVLLMAGPAVNVASMIVINKVMGWRSLLVYISSIVLGATAFALVIDYLFPVGYFTSGLDTSVATGHEVTLFRWISAVVLIILLANALIQRYFGGRKAPEAAFASLANGESCNVLHIGGMKCNHCAANAEKAIRSVAGVEDVVIDLPSGTAEVKGNCDINAVMDSVKAIGFEPSLAKTAEKSAK